MINCIRESRIALPCSSTMTRAGCITITRSGWKLAHHEPTSAYRHNSSGELRKLSRASGQFQRPSQAPDHGLRKSSSPSPKANSISARGNMSSRQGRRPSQETRAGQDYGRPTPPVPRSAIRHWRCRRLAQSQRSARNFGGQQEGIRLVSLSELEAS